jgi:acyl carrier protein
MPLSENEIRLKILDFLKSNFFVDPQSRAIEDTDSFLEKGIIDSTGVLEVINFIQTDFGFEIPDADILPENLDSIRNLVSYISKKMPSGK